MSVDEVNRLLRAYVVYDYTPNELLDIFMHMCSSSSLNLADDAKDWLFQYFEKKYLNRDNSFSNGRDVRNCFEKALINQANRLATKQHLTEGDISILLLEDVSQISS